VTAEELRQLARKYRRMGELRRTLPRAEEKKKIDEETRAELRQFAAAWPGALRELDSLATEEIDGRAEALEAAAKGLAPVEEWMRWMSGYHALMRDALAVRRGQAPPHVDEAFAHAVAKPPHGRIMSVIFDRLAAQHGTDRRTIWDALFPPRRGIRPYRQ
jgi:hypothetical protein